METLRFSLHALPKKEEGLTLALGFFDGVHLGHQKLFFEAAYSAEKSSGVLFFDALPFKKEARVLTSLEDKCRYAAKLRLDKAYILETSPEFFALSPEEFMKDFLLPLGVKRVVVGKDYRFGKDAKGTVEDLKRHFEVDLVDDVTVDGERVSTTLIKKAIEEGDVEKASALLGRPYEIHGKIIHGKQRGRTIGFPTANLGLDAPYVLPKEGIYGCASFLCGLPHVALVNVGKNPTFHELTEALVEAHLLDFEGDVYGQTMYLSFLAHGRGEKIFCGLAGLKEQLETDERWLRQLNLEKTF